MNLDRTTTYCHRAQRMMWWRVLFDVFVDVDDGGGWATGGWSTDCIDSRGRVAGGMMYGNLVCPPAGRRKR